MSHNTQAAAGQNQGRLPYAHSDERNSNCFGPPPSALRPPHSGISLTEVLIAMGILTVGLLGVASIFPVASFYMQKGDVADRGSAIAQAAFNDAIARGMLDPANWLMFQPTNGDPLGWRYTKPFASGLRNELAAQATQNNQLLRNRNLNQRFGFVYVLDPIGTNSSALNPTLAIDRQQMSTAQRFPIQASLDNYTNYSLWWPWNPVDNNQSWPRWPAVRVTLPQPPGAFSPWPLTDAVADKIFRSSDDLAIEVPAQSDHPSQQLVEKNDLNSDGKPDAMSRSSQGNYSWIATVAPDSANSRNALAIDPSAYEYNVSVAVFYKRVIDNAQDVNRGERLTIAKVVSSGLSGGELLIETKPEDAAAQPFTGLKVGNWIAVCGPHPASTNELPRFFFQWYRILSIESGSDVVSNPAKQRLVSLRGPQWPWQPAPNLTTNVLSNNLCLAIIPNVVAVHSKTIRLGGSSAWSAQ